MPRQKLIGRRVPLLLGAALLGLFVMGGGYAFAAHLEESDPFCSSCHTQPETTYVDRSQAAPPVDLASAHHLNEGTHCIDCHSGPGVTGRAATMVQVGAVDLIAYVTHTAKQPAPLTVPIADANCLKCHAEVPQTRNFRRHFHAFLPRWQALESQAATCVDCHSSHTTDGDPSAIFLEQSRTTAVCQSCHRALGERE